MPAPERSTRGVRPTPVGVVLVRDACPLLAHAERATAAVRRAGEEGELRAGFLSSVANHLMPPVVRAPATATSTPPHAPAARGRH